MDRTPAIVHVDGEPFALSAGPDPSPDARPLTTFEAIAAAIRAGAIVTIRFDLASRFLSTGPHGLVEAGGHAIGRHAILAFDTSTLEFEDEDPQTRRPRITHRTAIRCLANLGPRFGDGGRVHLLNDFLPEPIEAYAIVPEPADSVPPQT